MDVSGDSSSQQTWIPYEPPKDCQMGFCSIYCPQWCYIIFPPPPLTELADQNSSNTTFSPLVIAIIGILASGFFIVSYYTVISKHCHGFDWLRRRLQGSAAGNRELDDNFSRSHRNETMHVSPSDGLDEALINKITVYKYRRDEGFVDGTDCSVCLGEFQEDDSLRLLPKCSHAFHLQCIDIWLKSHSNCPLCRANIAHVNPTLVQQLSEPRDSENRAVVDRNRLNDEIVVVIEDVVMGGEEEHHVSNNDDASQPRVFFEAEEWISTAERKEDDDQPMQRSMSIDSSGERQFSIADVLLRSWEDEIIAAMKNGSWTGAGSSGRGGGEHCKVNNRSRGLHYVINSVSMKRSLSSRRFLARNGRGRNTSPVRHLYKR